MAVTPGLVGGFLPSQLLSAFEREPEVHTYSLLTRETVGPTDRRAE
jgi:hypothetical protein